jgi:pyruvate ferredoxin oxidoreductase alpha subunit
MSKRVGLEVSLALADVVRLANVDVVAAYPITPQTHIVEHLAELVADGKLDAEYIPVESEHSAMSACLGSAAVGARTFTATAGQGLELMHEVLFVASSMRLPMVMAVANRAISAPLNIWGDHSDVMAARDVGWIQIFTENGQEVVDNTLCAFRMTWDPRVLLPVMVHLDGFHLTHMIEPMMMPDQEEVNRFLPAYSYPTPLDPAHPLTMGVVGPPYIYTESKKAQVENLNSSRAVIDEVWAEFARQFGRQYHAVETYPKTSKKPKTLLMTMGSYSETAMEAIDKMRNEGKDVGLIRLRLWRPFPFEDLRRAVEEAEVIVVLDRAISFGGPGGPVASEVRSALYAQPKRPKVAGIVGGLGGRDITVAGFESIVERGVELVNTAGADEFEMFGVRE